MKKFVDEKGTWIVTDTGRQLIEPSEKFLKDRAKASKKQDDLKRLGEIDAEIYASIPDIIQKFLPLLETLGFELTKEQKKLFSERKSLKEKLK